MEGADGGSGGRGGAWGPLSLAELRGRAADFARERDWGQFHKPRNLLLALVGEVGELSEIFQWRGEVEAGCPDFEERERGHLGEELADVLVYLVRLADVCGVDLPSAVADKMRKNAEKYPVAQCRGSSAKYTAYS